MCEDASRTIAYSQAFQSQHAENIDMVQNSAIFTLNEDVLGHIFRMNADMDQDQFIAPDKTHPDYLTRRATRALSVTRRSSQVCRLWRDILLDSPSIWAQLIDWPIFRELETDDWLKETLCRSGGTPLHVKSDEWIRDGPRLQAFVSLLDTHWDRIRKLEFALWYIMTPGMIKTIYQILSRPANCLESLAINFEEGDGRFSFADAPILFSDQAPSLRDISLHWANFTFNPHASTFSNMRSLDIAYATYLKAPDVVEALSNAPLLELLGIRECHLIEYEKVEDRKAEIYLPELRHIRLVDPQIGACTSIIDAIVPGEGCVVNWSCVFTGGSGIRDPVYDEWSPALISRNLKELCSSFQWIAEDYTDSYSINALSVALKRDEFEFADISELHLAQTQLPSWDHLFLSIIEYLTKENIHSLFQSVSTTYLGDVKHMRLRFDPGVVDFKDFDFAGFFERMPLLEHLALSGYDSEVVKSILSGSMQLDRDIFPSLGHLTYLHWGDDSISEPLLAFLRWRRTMGVPIKTLDISLGMHMPCDLRCLEEMDGLRVVWRKPIEDDGYTEYLCGSGNPDMLIVGKRPQYD